MNYIFFSSVKKSVIIKSGDENMKFINRDVYLSRLIKLNKTPDIKIITGIRRSGKSRLIYDYIEYIKKKEKNFNIIYINLQDIEFEHLKEYHEMNTYILSKYKKNKNNYLFIDEVQLCPSFELAISSIHTKNIFDIYLTGSNAFLMSSDLATLFTGRTIEIEVYPFSFKEFTTYYDHYANEIENAFDDYVFIGGMPGSYSYNSESDKKLYIADVFKTIILRDLVQKYNIKDEETLEKLSFFMMDNISNITSSNNITESLTNFKINSSHNTIGNFISYLCNAFIFYKARRYDLKGKKYLRTTEKYYLCDHGFRYAILGKHNYDYGRIYENIVYIELLRRGYEVYIGKLYQKEIDFVATKGNEKFYIQVSDDISKQETFAREITPLLAIKDAYPKIIIARTRHLEYLHDGVKIINIANWLME